MSKISFINTPKQKIIFGQGAINSLQEEINGKKVVIITDNGVMESLGFLGKLINILQSADCSISVFQGIKTEPDIATVEKVKNFMIKEKPEVIIGLGGGSCLDAAKIGWAWYEHPMLEFDQLIKEKKLPNMRNTARYITIPTTSGTGSEVNPHVVVTDYRGSTPRKMGITHEEQIPDIAILDPLLTSTMSPALTASTGIDALSHALESYSRKETNDFIDAFSLHAIKLIFEYLPRAYKDGNDIEARSKMQNASALAGLAIGNSGAGIMHAMAHALGAEFGIPHGIAISLFMLDVIKFNCNYAPEKYLKIAESLGLKSDITTLVDKFKELLTGLKMPRTIREAGVSFDENKHLERVDRYVELTMADEGTEANIRPTGVNDIKNFFVKLIKVK